MKVFYHTYAGNHAVAPGKVIQRNRIHPRLLFPPLTIPEPLGVIVHSLENMKRRSIKRYFRHLLIIIWRDGFSPILKYARANLWDVQEIISGVGDEAWANSMQDGCLTPVYLFKITKIKPPKDVISYMLSLIFFFFLPLTTS